MSGDGLLLTPEEADRFARWLEREAETGRLMIEQFEKISGPATAALVAREKQEVAAALIIARKIRSIERVEIAPKDVA